MKILVLLLCNFIAGSAFALSLRESRFADVKFEFQYNERLRGDSKVLPRSIRSDISVGLHTYVLTDIGIYRIQLSRSHEREGRVVIPCRSGEITKLEALGDGRRAFFATSEGHVFEVDLSAKRPERSIRAR